MSLINSDMLAAFCAQYRNYTRFRKLIQVTEQYILDSPDYSKRSQKVSNQLEHAGKSR